MSRSKTFEYYIDEKDLFSKEAILLLKKEYPLRKPVRLLGITRSNFKEENHSPVQATINFK